jgi:hypothetical protein
MTSLSFNQFDSLTDKKKVQYLKNQTDNYFLFVSAGRGKQPLSLSKDYLNDILVSEPNTTNKLNEIFNYNFKKNGDVKDPQKRKQKKQIGPFDTPTTSELAELKQTSSVVPRSEQIEFVEQQPEIVGLSTDTIEALARAIGSSIKLPQQTKQETAIVNVEQPEINVDVDVESIVKQLQALRGGMVRPSNLRGIVQQVKELGTITNKNTSRVVRAIEEMASTTPTQTDIQNVVDELLEVSAGVEMISEDIQKQTEVISEDIQKQTEVITNVGNEIGRQIGYQTNTIGEYINPYHNKTREQVIQEYNRLGGLYLESLTPETKEDIVKKVDMLKAIKAQNEALVDYQLNKPYSIERGYNRLGFDTFIKTISENPMNQSFKFIQKSIPEITLKYDPNKSRFEVKQGSDIQLEKNYNKAKEFAIKGGFYQDELKELRNAKSAVEKRVENRCFVIKSRKL